MKEDKRIPQAPSEPLPELSEFLVPFKVHFSRRESWDALECYTTGLLTEHPNKNCDTLAEIVPGTSAQSLQGLLTEMVWDERDLNRQRMKRMLALSTEGEAVLIFEDTGFAKQGACSVGVARQYSGTLGKVANCQVTVNCHYAERTLGWVVMTQLYLPESWAHDPVRRKTAQIPESVQFQTKAEIALAELDQANRWNIPHVCVTADADYGDNPNFLNGLEQRHERHVVAVRASFSVALGRGAAFPVQRADVILHSIPRREWKTIRWAKGSQDWLRAKFVAVRCWRVDGDGTRHVGWLIGQRPSNRHTGDWKYVWSDFPRCTALTRMVEYAHRRHWVEQFHAEAKDLLGWDQYQGRRWGGFHRHAAVIMLAHSFLVWLEWQTRPRRTLPGRPRGKFSPRPDPRRQSLASLHCHIVERLRGQAILELIAKGLVEQFCSELK